MAARPLLGNAPTLGDVIGYYWPVLACSFCASLLATPLCRKYATAKGIVDRPDDFLKPHKKPIPYLGGVAIFLGWVAGVVVSLALFRSADTATAPGLVAPSVYRPMVVAVLAAGAMIVVLGLIDDLRLLSPKVKLAGTVLASVLLIVFGIGDDTIHIILRSIRVERSDFPKWLALAYSVPLTVGITVSACNAANLIDGVDGLCSGVLGIIAAGFLVLAVHLHVRNTWSPWEPLDTLRVVLSLAMLGAALGFLPYNRNPATIFMGDAGSMLLGLNVAIVLLLFAKSNATRWMLGALMMFALPLGDMVLAIVRRWRNGKPVMQGDRSHFYDQLVDRGLAVRKVVAISYGLAAFFAVVGCAPIALRTRYVVPLYLLVVILVIIVIAKYDMVRLERRNERNP